MTPYIEAVDPAIKPLRALNKLMLSDLSQVVGGIGWWAEHLDAPLRILISDYLIGLNQSCEDNLVEASMHAARAEEMWLTLGFNVRKHARDPNADLTLIQFTGRNRELGIEADAHVVGFFRALGTVLDNLAGIVIGVAGLEVDLVKASWNHLKLKGDAPAGAIREPTPGREMQIQLVAALRGAINSGPRGWDTWVLDSRNTFVHRGRRLSWVIEDRKRTDLFFRPLPADPDLTDVQAFSQPGATFEGDTLAEHASDTMQGVLGLAVDVVAGTITAAVDTWASRKTDPGLIKQPAKQWPLLKRGTRTGFKGINPAAKGRSLRPGALVVNPERARRFQAAKTLDSDRRLWDAWLKD